ncbi:uncharacterized protein LOC128032539 [Gossypium raimondii]|uniref:uncharacterized protein LOC128032539 n=1 Tax=Gossypium raimondii TaxID=29730 RepID=UPI00227A8CA2|nr:uncharacterized protein LOC128032539 [Gossypium raimondii]
MSGEMIESAKRSGKIDVGENNRRKVVANQHGSSKQESGARPSIERPQFTPIPMSYKELYQNLFNTHVVAPFYLTPLQPPYPKWYDANAQCDYHAGITGYSIEHCITFKRLVEKLINMGVVKVDDASGTGNPLPNHTDSGVNMMSENVGRRVNESVAKIKIPLMWIWKEIVRRGLIVSGSEGCCEIPDYCEFHHEVGHEIQKYGEFKALVQSMMDNREVKYFEEVNEARVQVTPKIVIQKLAKFSYKDSNKVPWNYECDVTVSGKEASVSVAKENQKIGSYTNTEKHCGWINSQAESAEGKVFAAEQKEEKTVESRPLINEPIKEEEATEFLKFLKHSEYSVVEQLHKQPASISVLPLLMSLEVHRNALMKVLNETYVANDISVSKLDLLVNNISADNFNFFNDNEIPSGGMGSTKALLPVDSSHMKMCQNVARAFDGTERKVMGRIEIPLQIGPSTYEVDFIVMDIKPSYNCLLGRPWIHSAGAVPSSLHQKLKLVSEG